MAWVFAKTNDHTPNGVIIGDFNDRVVNYAIADGE